jgi:peptidoglycan/LPS O-acetylase OafA/YrhL
VGSFVALVARGEKSLDVLAPLAKKTMLLCGLLLLPLLCRWPEWVDRSNQAVGYSLLDVFFASTLVLALSAHDGSLCSRAFHNSWLAFLGKYSYGLYVYNSIIANNMPSLTGRLCRLASWPESAELNFFLSALLSFSASIVIAWLSWHLFERHFLSLKKYFSYERAGSPSCVR